MSNMTTAGYPPLLVSTDLDGTLLDHHTYDWAPAKPGLELLAQREAPVIINTSKTFEEVVKLQSELGITEPFVVENGSALFLPKIKYPQPDGSVPGGAIGEAGDHWQVIFGEKRETIVTALKKQRDAGRYVFTGFADMDLQQLIDHTGLPEENAKLAMLRRFSEPLIWRDSQESYQSFKSDLESDGFRVIQGGRFTHVLGKTDKGVAIRWFKEFYKAQYEIDASIIALGDSPNDTDMLNIADYAVAVRSPSHDYPAFETAGITIKTKAFGPAGWTEAIKLIIQISKKQA